MADINVGPGVVLTSAARSHACCSDVGLAKVGRASQMRREKPVGSGSVSHDLISRFREER